MGEKSLWEQALGGNGNRTRTILKTYRIDVKHGAGEGTRTLDVLLGAECGNQTRFCGLEGHGTINIPTPQNGGGPQN